jgi:hypothetical protein
VSAFDITEIAQTHQAIFGKSGDPFPHCLCSGDPPATNDKTTARDAKPPSDGFSMFDAMERDA